MKFSRTILSDAALLITAYLAAYVVRLQFGAPSCGYPAAIISVISALIVQTGLLTLFGLNTSYRWRVFGRDLPRYAAVFMLSAAFLLVMRILAPDYSWARPPYSVTLIDMVFAFVAIVGYRFLRERWNLDHSVFNLPRVAALESDCAYLRDKVVMITGAGGTIGGEIVRQVTKAGAKQVLMVERSENALYKIDLEVDAIPLMVDINEKTKMEAIFELYKPAIIFHAAAYKHVPMCEANVEEAKRNNTEATRELVKMSKAHGVEKFVFISTDKAVNPISVMGKTKREAEKYVLEAGYRVVRFGNVFGSSGSVIERWRNQIAKGEALTVTDKRMTRYFMSVEEAVALVITAGSLEPGCIYTLDMGKPFSILELAERLIREAGYRPYTDIPIVFTGIRAGEKLEEDLGVDSSEVLPTSKAKIFVTKPLRTRC